MIDPLEEELEDWRDRLKSLAGAPRLGIDTGGTFTDFVLETGGTITTWKVRSTPADPGLPIRESAVSEGPLFVGTTVGTNAVLERKGASVALITTAGFEDLVELARQNRASLYDLNPPAVEPLIPASLRFGADERVLHDGSVDSGLDARRLRNIVEWIGQSGAESVAVLFLHSVRNDVHEKMVHEALAAAFPALPVSLSSRVLPEPREYERLCATVLNAALVPLLGRYVDGLGAAGRPIGMAVSSGGVLPATLSRAEPVRTILSGPAAGVVAAHRLASSAALGPLLTLDMGGTSTDVSWVDPGGEIELTTAAEVGGWPVALPSVDVVTVGAGGGSVARLDAAGALTVGPESAGADPGPAAYGRGGPATLTDALVVLGRLPEEIPIAGGVLLDRQAATRVVGELAGALGRGPIDTALAIVDTALARMERALRKASSARGRDPRGATLLAYGGAGGLLAADLARRLGIARVIVPPSPGVFSAWGTLAAPARLDRARAVRLEAKSLDGGSPWDPFWKWLGPFVPALPGESGFFPSFGARYPGQSRDLVVTAAGEWEQAFHDEHERRAGYARRDVRPLITTLRVSMRYAGPVPPLPAAGPPLREPGAARNVTFGRDAAARTTVVTRAMGAPGSIIGPVIIVESGAVVVVPPGTEAITRDGGLLEIRVD